LLTGDLFLVRAYVGPRYVPGCWGDEDKGIPGPVMIELVTYDSTWPARFAEEAARRWSACGDAVLRIDHVGSTTSRRNPSSMCRWQSARWLLWSAGWMGSRGSPSARVGDGWCRATRCSPVGCQCSLRCMR